MDPIDHKEYKRGLRNGRERVRRVDPDKLESKLDQYADKFSEAFVLGYREAIAEAKRGETPPEPQRIVRGRYVAKGRCMQNFKRPNPDEDPGDGDPLSITIVVKNSAMAAPYTGNADEDPGDEPQDLYKTIGEHVHRAAEKALRAGKTNKLLDRHRHVTAKDLLRSFPTSKLDDLEAEDTTATILAIDHNAYLTVKGLYWLLVQAGREY